MGLLSGLIGNASEVAENELSKTLDGLLIEGEKVDVGFKVLRDMLIFTNKRLILVDKQGVTGKKVEYHTIPYRSIDHFAIETSGHFDLDAELKIWVKGGFLVTKEFKKGNSINGVQKALATYLL